MAFLRTSQVLQIPSMRSPPSDASTPSDPATRRLIRGVEVRKAWKHVRASVVKAGA